MTIVCTVTNDLSHDQRMHRICTSLQEAGHSVTLVGRQLPTSPPLTEKPYRQLRLRCARNRGKAFYAEFNARLYRRLRGEDFDLVYSVDLDTLLAGYFLHFGGRKWVYDAHEWFSETPEVHHRPAIRMAWDRFGKWLVPKTDARITVGPALGGKLEDAYGVPFGTIRNVPYYNAGLKSEILEGVILYQGMLNPGRGLETLIESMAYLPEEACWIVGDGPERKRLERLAATLQVSERVWFAGYRPPERLGELTRKAWLGVNLLVSDSPSYYYSLANKALDYVQAGLPSIQMDFPEYRALNETYDCYRLLPELRTDLLVAEVEHLRDHPEQYAELRRNCRRAATELCWEREEQRLLTLIESLRH